MSGFLNRLKVLVVDDEEQIISSVKLLLADQPQIEVIGASNAGATLEMFEKRNHQFALVLMDYNLEGISGAELTQKILNINPHQIIAMYSGVESREAAVSSWRSGAVDVLHKRNKIIPVR